MRAVSDALLIAGEMAVVGYALHIILPNSKILTINWQTQQFLIPYNVAAFWGCVALGVIAGVIQAIRVLLRDAQRLQ